VPWIILNGGPAYLEIGKPNNGGTKIFSVVGDVERPGNYEVPLGLPFAKLLELAGGVKGGRALKAVIPGGSSAPILPKDICDTVLMDFDALREVKSALGTAGLIVMDKSTDVIYAVARLSRFYMHESCGQCTPCREGTGWMYRVMQRMVTGNARSDEIDMLLQVTKQIDGRSICALGDAAAWPVQALIRHFRDEMEERIRDHRDRAHRREAAE